MAAAPSESDTFDIVTAARKKVQGTVRYLLSVVARRRCFCPAVRVGNHTICDKGAAHSQFACSDLWLRLSCGCGLQVSRPQQVQRPAPPASPLISPIVDFSRKLRAAWQIFFPPPPALITPKEEGKNRLRMILVADRHAHELAHVALACCMVQ